MLFKRFLDKRKRASKAAKEVVKAKSQETLKDQALRHADPQQRRVAIQQITDLRALDQARRQDADPEIRERAAARTIEVLFQEHSEPPSAALLTDIIAGIDDAALLARIAREAWPTEARRLAIERIEAPGILADCAVEDRVAANRVLAAERLEAKDALEDVLRRIGKRDKSVHRITREKLKHIAEQEERPRLIRAQCEDICGKIERLGRLGNWTQDRALLDHLQRQWAEVQDEAEPEWRIRFQAERDRFLSAFDAYCRENAAQIAEQEAREAARQEAEQLLASLQTLVARGESETLEAECERIAHAWQELPALPEQDRTALNRRYDRLMQALGTTRQSIVDRRRQGTQLGKLLEKAEGLLADSKALEHQKVTTLLQNGRALCESLSGTEQTTVFTTLAERLEARLQHQRKNAEQKLKQFQERLQTLEAHLAAGELKKADPIYQSLQASLELIHASGLRKAEEAKLSGRLRALAPRLRELQTWRRWGADQHREGLCSEMEALIAKELPLETLAEQLRALQADWKGLDKTGSPANQALWERFHQASESVFERCRPHMEAQAAEREANRAARERVCAQLEDFLSKVDWERVDWKKMLRAEREMRQTWASIGPTEGRHRKPLERRFHQALRHLDQRLDAERKRNQAHKQHLVERVQALVALPDLDAAIEQTKAIQREWHTTVPVRQKDENKLWQSFRGACDAVFERRAALQQAHVSELKQNLETREALCREASEIAERESDPRRLAAAQRDLIERWRTSESLPVPRQSAGPLAQSWRRSLAQLDGRIRAAEEQQQAAYMDLLKRQADLCQQLELRLLDGTAESLDTADLRETWSRLGRQEDEALQAAIEHRFEQALAAAQDPMKRVTLQERLPQNADLMSHLCLQLEIIAGVESPPELAKQRLELQVARLAERMTEGEDDPLQGAGALLRDWYLCGPAPHNEALLDRFQRVSDTLTKHRISASPEPV